MLRRHLLPVLLIQAAFSIGAPSRAHSDESPPLHDLVLLGAEHAYPVQIQKLRLESTASGRTSAYFSLLPTLSLTGDRTFTQSTTLSSGVRSTTSYPSSSLSISAEWTLWNNFQNIRDVKLAHKALLIERNQTSLEIENYALSVITLYVDLQVLYAQRENLKEALAYARVLADEAADFVKLGAKTRLDTMDTDIQVQNLLRDQDELDRSIQNAEQSLLVALNLKTPVRLQARSLKSNPPYFIRKMDENYASIKSRLLEHIEASSPEVRISVQKLDKTLEELHQTRIGYLPTVTLKASHSIDLSRFVAHDTDAADRGSLPTSAIALSFSWEFWDWLGKHRSIQNSERDYRIGELQLEEQLKKARIDSKNQIDQYETLLRTLEISEKIVSQAEMQLDYSKSLYQLGRISLLQAQTASQRLSDARLSLLNRLKAKFLLAAKLLIQAGETILPGDLGSLSN